MPGSRPLIPLLVALAVALTACSDRGPASAAQATASCGEVSEPPVQEGNHLIGDQEPPVPYSSAPPTSGWHASGAFDIGVQAPDDPLSEPRQVSVLEVGGVVVAYRDLSDDDRAALEALVREEYPGRVAVTAYDGIEPGQVALTAWGRLQVCDALDLDAVRAFADAYADAEPGTPGAH